MAALKVANVSPLCTSGAIPPFKRAITSVLVVVTFGVVVDAGKNIRHIEHALTIKIKHDPPTCVLLKMDDIDADLAVVARLGHPDGGRSGHKRPQCSAVLVVASKEELGGAVLLTATPDLKNHLPFNRGTYGDLAFKLAGASEVIVFHPHLRTLSWCAQREMLAFLSSVSGIGGRRG